MLVLSKHWRYTIRELSKMGDMVGVIHPDIAKATTLPAHYYTEATTYGKMLEKFATTWNFVGFVAMFGNTTKQPTFVGTTPMLLTHEGDSINCISNVCTHRGMVLLNEPKSGGSIVCPYHGRMFNLCGDIKHMPEFVEVENFPSKMDDLPKTKLEDWHGLLFTTFNETESFSHYISVVEKRMDFLNLNNLKYDPSRDRVHKIKTNWMLYVDNYLEGFHIPFVHDGLNEVLDYSQYETELFDNGVLQVGYAKPGESCFEIPDNHVDSGKSIAAYYWWLFPNLMLNFYPWGVSINIVRPVDVGITEVKYYGFVLDLNKIGEGAGGDLDSVEFEDQEIVEACYQGMQSIFYQQGRYSPRMEQGVHHFHRLMTQ